MRTEHTFVVLHSLSAAMPLDGPGTQNSDFAQQSGRALLRLLQTSPEPTLYLLSLILRRDLRAFPWQPIWRDQIPLRIERHRTRDNVHHGGRERHHDQESRPCASRIHRLPALLHPIEGPKPSVRQRGFSLEAQILALAALIRFLFETPMN